VALVFFSAIGLRAGAADGFRYLKPIHASDKILRPSEFLPGQAPVEGFGYDGQMYFVIAQDPFLTRSDTAASLDTGSRYHRILYPVLAWALAGGRRELLPFSLMGVNLAAGVVLTAVLAAWCARRGRSVWLALVVTAFPGVWVPALLDLTEPTQLALMAGGVLLGSAGTFLAATLAREQAGVTLAAYAFDALRRRAWSTAARFTVAVAAYAAWWLLVQLTVHGYNTNAAFFSRTHPFTGAFLVLASSLHDPARLLVTASAVATCLLIVLRGFIVREPVSVAAAAYAAIALWTGTEVWDDPMGFYRTFAGAVVLLFMSWCARRDRLGAGAVWLVGVSSAFSLAALAAAFS
jgi:hypothetical protein